MVPTTKFANPFDGTTFDIKGYINCKTKCVIYCLIFPSNKLYTGQVMQHLHQHIQKHMATITLADHDLRLGKKLTTVAKHFQKFHIEDYTSSVSLVICEGGFDTNPLAEKIQTNFFH